MRTARVTSVNPILQLPEAAVSVEVPEMLWEFLQFCSRLCSFLACCFGSHWVTVSVEIPLGVGLHWKITPEYIDRDGEIVRHHAVLPQRRDVEGLPWGQGEVYMLCLLVQGIHLLVGIVDIGHLR